jgi:hypothetical protein
MRDTRIEIICDGALVNAHSDDQRHGWDNPLSILPPQGSIIQYMTFNQNHKEGLGVMTEYKVINYLFTTEENYNNSYHNKVCKILVEKA